MTLSSASISGQFSVEQEMEPVPVPEPYQQPFASLE
jgi:hypothetical protein